MNSQQLSSQAQSLRTNAESSRNEAERHLTNAEAFRNDGDTSRAEVEQSKADRLLQDVAACENEADQLEQASIGQDVQRQRLQHEEEQLKAEYEAKIKAIEDQISRL